MDDAEDPPIDRVPPFGGERAVAVAKDVLERLEGFNFQTGYYLEVFDKHAVSPATAAVRKVYEDRVAAAQFDQSGTVVKSPDLQPFVDDLRRGCRACLLGGCLLTKARLYDRVPLLEVVKWSGETGVAQVTVRKLLADVFDLATLANMEAAFEMRESYSVDAGVPENEALAAASFGMGPEGEISSPRERVARVMAEVVRAGGVFHPKPIADADKEDVVVWLEDAKLPHDD